MTTEWLEQEEDILKSWGEICACYRWLHDRSHRKYRRKSIFLNLPIILLSTITGTANFASGNFEDPEDLFYLQITLGTINILTSMISSISQYLKISEFTEAHRITAIAYGKLSRLIRVELSLPTADRNMSGLKFLKKCRQDLDDLLEQSPEIPLGILEEFKKKFQNSTIVIPEIIDIEEIQIYREKNILTNKKSIDSIRKNMLVKTISDTVFNKKLVISDEEKSLTGSDKRENSQFDELDINDLNIGLSPKHFSKQIYKLKKKEEHESSSDTISRINKKSNIIENNNKV
jgi:hypothetical protein